MKKRTHTYRLGFAVLTTVIVEVILAAFLAVGYFVLLQAIPGVRLANPDWIWLFAAGPVFTLVFLAMLWWKKKALAGFSEAPMLAHLSPMISTGKTVLKFLLFRVGVFFLTLAAINPQMGSKMTEAKQEGVDLMIAIDVSSSMLSEDIRPNRLVRARMGISQLIDKLHGDRVGIIVFAGDAYVQLPITTDYSAARMFLNTIDTDIVPVQGTSIGAAINLSLESFDFENGTKKAIIIISDGEDHEAEALNAARKAAEKEVIIHTIGMGTEQGGPIPLYKGKQQIGFKKDKDGKTVVTRLNEKMLQDISTAAGGEFVRASTAQMGINALLEEIKTMNKTEFGTIAYSEYEDRFQVFLGIALVFLLLEWIVAERRSKWREKFNLFN